MNHGADYCNAAFACVFISLILLLLLEFNSTEPFRMINCGVVTMAGQVMTHIRTVVVALRVWVGIWARTVSLRAEATGLAEGLDGRRDGTIVITRIARQWRRIVLPPLRKGVQYFFHYCMSVTAEIA